VPFYLFNVVFTPTRTRVELNHTWQLALTRNAQIHERTRVSIRDTNKGHTHRWRQHGCFITAVYGCDKFQVDWFKCLG